MAVSVDFKRLFALIIGIDNYEDPSIQNLSGAVLDAENVKNCLTDTLGVLQSNIQTLYDTQATKVNILNAIRGLADIPIAKDDPILIYYAGHGGRAPAPAGWFTSDSSNEIEMLCPHDFKQSGSDTKDGQGIFDLTLAHYFNDLADKWENISVIFDCCHSGSATRDDKVRDDERVRGIELPKDYVIPLSVFEQQVDRACRRDEKAGERSYGGYFTSELLKLFNARGPEGISDLTYQDVIETINLELHTLWQNPQCVGAKQGRLLFSTTVPGPDRASLIGISTKSDPGEFRLDAGEADGILKGAEFNIYSDKNMTNFVGKVIADAPRRYDTTCRVADDVQFPLDLRTAFALPVHIGLGRDICLFVPSDTVFSELRTALTKHMQRRDKMQGFCLLDSEHDNPPDGPRADLALRVVKIGDDSFVQFDVKDQKCIDMGLTKMPYHVSLCSNEVLMTVLRCAADFYWKFRNNPSLSSYDITLECFELEEDPNQDTFKPKNDRQNLINTDGMIILNSVTRQRSDVATVPYGYRINNRTKKSFYAALFYFDFSSLSIVSLYIPDSARRGKLEFSIQPGSCVTIGYGDSGTSPIEFRMRREQDVAESILQREQDVDVGFLRLYASTHCTKYLDIVQESPLEDLTRYTQAYTGGSKVVFGTLTIPVVTKTRSA
ncbi:hypothetical protein D9758_018630 [Tetrapyrgos nigripes]|uniref:Peptidase C14 caspase domain-containing protein n=1 Tax=Tetrapyrgos nigripes TaxID=182062 RepID=A0A8H5B6U2_9AGAR|nr:hypothetical protein D9758_018630 [Tetrapyrgos nigripes]